jgi:hypothetical protein
VRWTSFASLLVGLVSLALATAVCAGAPDRLDRFRELAPSVLAGAPGIEDPVDAYREIYQLLDEEIVESLASGGVFASLGFLQDRLDAFGEAWGATVVRLARVGDLLVGAFQPSDAPAGNSVRVYGRMQPGGASGGDAALLTTISREGRPSVLPLATTRGAAQFLIAWEGAPTGRGSRHLRIDLARQHADEVRVVWSTAELFPDGLMARRWTVRGSEIRVQYEVRYPGWAPGCDGQTEQEDVYRLDPVGTVVRVSRRPVNAWHREFRTVVRRLFDAVEADDHAALVNLVPDAGLRAQLPRTLAPEPACDARDTSPSEHVSVAARDAERPWQLVFQRGAAGWRLLRATPVLQ